ncbi:unnamed protein product [Mytilus coruscus]|uniref:Uncharacterized protein n=1 Tax=Mytilus coruscus TaxID=42192 RepID=A0A6J8CPQ3_MYTCO|nr:unnamed protein product [Mytilus coruscus]
MSSHCYVATFRDNIYHTNNETNTVTCYNLQGKIQWTFHNKSVLKSPLGIDVDNDGNVYVVGFRSINVVVISPDGQRYREILTASDSLSSPNSLHFSRSNNQLVAVKILVLTLQCCDIGCMSGCQDPGAYITMVWYKMGGCQDPGAYITMLCYKMGGCQDPGAYITMLRYKMGDCQDPGAYIAMLWQVKLCTYPDHTGKGKTFRGISTTHSQHILEEYGVLLPVGTGVCHQCYLKLPKQDCMNEENLQSFSQELSVAESTEEDGQFYKLGEQQVYNNTVTLQPRDKEATSLENSQSCIDDAVVDSDFQSINTSSSQPLSQILSWSEENIDTVLTDLNDAIGVLGHGQISPIKYRVRRDLDLLQPSSLRTVKRKAGETINLFLDELQQLIPGVTVHAIDEAHKHATKIGAGMSVPSKEPAKRQKMDREKLDHALDFFFDPTFHQITAFGTKEMKLSSGTLLTIPNVVRTAYHSTLVDTYLSYCSETSFDPLCKSSLYKILIECPASRQTNLKGLDNIAANGNSAYDTLMDVIAVLENQSIGRSNALLKECKEKLQSSKLYLKTEYKLHLERESRCPDHCINFALSDKTNRNLTSQCCNHDHDMSCDRCNDFDEAFSMLRSFVLGNDGMQYFV